MEFVTVMETESTEPREDTDNFRVDESGFFVDAETGDPEDAGEPEGPALHELIRASLNDALELLNGRPVELTRGEEIAVRRINDALDNLGRAD